MEQKFNPQKIKAIIGLGNASGQFQNTFHNAGHLFIDYLKKNGTERANRKLLKSDSFMNDSGKFVKKIIKKYRLKSEELLIAQDDSDIEMDSYKLSFGRGSAGHKGIESIIKNLGGKNFWRLRIGVRPRTGTRRLKAGEFVLKKISAQNKKSLEKTFDGFISLLET